MTYPPNWPKCPHCGDPCMDGKATCGNSVCMIVETAKSDYEHAVAHADADESATDLEERLELAMEEADRLESYRESRRFFREEHR